jgi:hypothetical protein
VRYVVWNHGSEQVKGFLLRAGRFVKQTQGRLRHDSSPWAQDVARIFIKNEEVEEIEFKNMVMKLMDDILSIRSYGSARPEIMIPTQIVGKEMFVEALSDLISKKSKKEASCH